jgi:hypothetical protein
MKEEHILTGFGSKTDAVLASVKSTPTQLEFTAREGMAKHRAWMHEKLDEWINAHREEEQA